GIDSVNLYNGHVQHTVPLLTIGGRGDASYTMAATLSPQWNATGDYDTSGTGGACLPQTPCPTWTFIQGGWAGWSYRYQPAATALRRVGTGTQSLGPPNGCSATYYVGTLT